MIECFLIMKTSSFEYSKVNARIGSYELILVNNRQFCQATCFLIETPTVPILWKGDDVVVHDVHGPGHQEQGSQPCWHWVPVLSHGAQPAWDPGFHHRTRHDCEYPKIKLNTRKPVKPVSLNFMQNLRKHLPTSVCLVLPFWLAVR